MLNAVNINLVAFSRVHTAASSRPGLRAVRHHHRRRRGRRRPRHRPAHLPQPAQRRPRRGRPAEGLTASVARARLAHPARSRRSRSSLILLLRQAPAAQGLRDRHRRGRRVVRAVVVARRPVDPAGRRRRGGARRGGLGALGRSVASLAEAEEHADAVVEPVVQHVTWWQNGGVEFGVGTRSTGSP